MSRSLLLKGILACVPLAFQQQSYGGIALNVEVPLFKNHIFIHGNPAELVEVIRAEGVIGIVTPADAGQLQWELNNIFLASSSGLCLRPCDGFNEAATVEVFAGSMRGLQGYRVEGRDELILSVQSLGRFASTVVDTRLLRPAGRVTSLAV